MAKKRPAQKPTQKKTVKPTAPPKASWELPGWMSNSRLNSLIFFALALLLYANTLKHGFVQDDAIVITENMFTTEGVKGISGILSYDTFYGFFKEAGKETLVSGGRYRPMTLVLFALVYELFGDAPFIFHLLTVLLFAFTCVVLYQTLLLLFRDRPGAPNGTFIAWAATLLFTVHPIHTEVVANIKGCDEIVTLLGSLGALYFTLRYVDTGKLANAIWAFLVFFMACMSKENAATFTVVIPLALWFFRPKKEVKIWQASLPVWIAFIIFFVIRGTILDWRFGGEPMELMNNPFLKIEGNRWVKFAFTEKLATIFYTLLLYIKLLFVPWPLTHDYYPRHIGIISFANPIALISLLFHAGLAWYAISGLKHKDPVRFGILVYGLTISIVSNLVFPVGTNMGERFAFMPSVGFTIAIGGLLALWVNADRMKTVLIGLGMVAAAYSVMTVMRNLVWESNERLFFTDVNTSGNSAKIRNACGSIMLERAIKSEDENEKNTQLNQSLMHLNKAIEIYPNYVDALISRGGCHYYLEQFDNAIADYRRAMKIAPNKPKPRLGLTLSLRDGGKHYGQVVGDLARSEQYLMESWELNDQDGETAHSLGVLQGIQGRPADALPWFEKAVKLSPDNKLYHQNLAKSYYAVGNKAKGDEHMALSQ